MVAKAAKPTEPVLALEDAAAWDRWLAAHHATSPGVWLRLVKGERGAMTYAHALDVALAWGWIDSQKKTLDARAWVQRFTRRTATSPWSKINRAKAEALIARGAMRPAGLREVGRAKQDGRWERAYDGARTSAVPPDLAAALAKNRRAGAFFASLDAANRYAILWRVQTAKKPETRADRIARFVAMCARHETLHPPKAKRPAAKRARRT